MEGVDQDHQHVVLQEKEKKTKKRVRIHGKEEKQKGAYLDPLVVLRQEVERVRCP